MTQGKMQIAPQIPGPMMDKRVITISRPQRPDSQVDADDPLLINVLRRRWMLLGVCLLLSLIAAGLVASRFRMPKAITTGQLRYVALPPTLQGIYTAPQTLELVEIMMSNEKMAELAQRCGLQIDPKVMRERFQVEAKRYSNIIDVELRWKEGKQSIDLVNSLMKIACETTAASRKQTLGQYQGETNLQYEASNQRVIELRDKVLQLRQARLARLNGDGLGGENDTKRLMDRLANTEDEMDQLTLERVSLNRQLATLKSELETVQGQVRQELIKGRRQQVASRKRIWSPNSDKFVKLVEVEQELDKFHRREPTAGLHDMASQIGDRRGIVAWRAWSRPAWRPSPSWNVAWASTNRRSRRWSSNCCRWTALGRRWRTNVNRWNAAWLTPWVRPMSLRRS